MAREALDVAPPPQPRPRRPPLPRTITVDAERAAYIAVFALALVLRLAALGERPLHHDESSHAWFSWRLFTGEGYSYDPVYHGPVQFYLDSMGYLLVGVGEVGVRLGGALAGAGMTLLPLLLRRQLGAVAALAASVLLCVSPSFLYFSRFAREDIYAVTLTFALIVVAFRFLDRPRPWHPALLLGLLAVSFATKETTYITAFVAGTGLLAALGWQAWEARRHRRPVRSARLVRTITSVGLDAWIWGLATFATVFTVLFTTFFFNPQGLRDGLWDSIAYWLSQHPVERGAQPHYFYGVLLVAYELPVVVLGVVGVVAALRRRTLLDLFLVWDLTLSLVIYSWAGERMPWLVVHPLLPLVLLAGIGFQALWRARRRGARVAALAVCAVGGLYAVHGVSAVVYDHPADPSEPLVFVQTSTDVPPVRDALVRLDRAARTDGRPPPTILVDSWGGTGWPWGWYLRDLPVAYADLSTAPAATIAAADVVVAAEPNNMRVAPLVGQRVTRRFHLREWWVVDYGRLTPGAAWRWFLWRQSWSPEATMDEFLYVRPALAPALSAAPGLSP